LLQHHAQDGSIWEQYWFNVKNSHVLLGICCAHRHHPFSRCERFFLLATVLMIQFAFSLIPDVATGETPEQPEDLASMEFPLSVAVAIVVTILTSILKLAATVDDQCCGDRQGGIIRLYLKCSGRALIGWQFIIATMILATIGSSVPAQKLLSGARVFAISLAQSWTFTFMILSSLSFCWTWRKQKQEAAEMDRRHSESKAKWEEEQTYPPVEVVELTPSTGTRVTPRDLEQRAVDAIDALIYKHSAPKAPSPKRRERTVVSPKFSLSFKELVDWDAGVDIDAGWEASKTGCA
jgi:hypothetical protein